MPSCASSATEGDLVVNTRTTLLLGVPIIAGLACASAQSQTVGAGDPLRAFCAGTSVCADSQPVTDSPQFGSNVSPGAILTSDPQPTIYSFAGTPGGAADTSSNFATAASVSGRGTWSGAGVTALTIASAPPNTAFSTFKVQTNAGASSGAFLGTLETLRPGSFLTGFLDIGTPSHAGGVTAPTNSTLKIAKLPEPDTLALLVAGGIGLALAGWIRRGRSSRL
jgi:hypothetical protein